MAIVKNNIITKGLSGSLGHGIVFRQVGERTIVSMPPVHEKAPSLKQKVHRERFQLAIIYAKAQLQDSASKAEYQLATNAQNPHAYTIAVSDFMKAPSIDALDVSKYTGKVGETILIRATDDFKVKTVTVTIANADGTLVEKGNAMQQANQLDWLYTATKANASLAGDKLTVTAADKPGNLTTKERTL